eukprot:gene68975-biopygen50757
MTFLCSKVDCRQIGARTGPVQARGPRDAFVSNHYGSLPELPQGAKVGTSSLRRVVQLRALRPESITANEIPSVYAVLLG